MEKYKKKIKKRIGVMSLVMICIAVIYFMLPVYSDALPQMPDFIRGFHAGAFAGVELVMVFFIVKYIIGMRKDESLRKLYIEENDERTKMIMAKSGALGMGICMVGLATGTVVAGFVNQTVFFALLGALLFISLVRASIKVYYHLKM
jgi:hypothetical protein